MADALSLLPEGFEVERSAAISSLPSGFEIVAPEPGGDAPGVMPALIAAESGGNPNAVSPKGAMGLAQLMPGTARDLGVTDPFDPEQSRNGGETYLRQQIKRFGNLPDALAAYNWGPGNVSLWIASGRDPSKLPKETRDFVSRVTATAPPTQPAPENPSGTMTEAGMVPPLPASTGNLADAGREAYRRLIERPAENLKAGYLASASGLYGMGANATMLVNKAAQYLAAKAGLQNPTREHLDAAEAWLRDTARRVAPDAKTIDDDLAAKIYQGLGSAPVAVAEYLTGTRALGPVLGFAAVDALNAADKGPEATAEAALKGAILGKTFQATEPLARVPRTAALGAIGGTQAAAEGGDAKDITAGAATLGILGAVSPGGTVTTRRMIQDAREAYTPTEAAPKTETRIPESNFDSRGSSGADELPPRAEMESRIGARAMQPGVNYVGQRADAAGVAEPVRAEPIRREDILRPLVEAMGVPLYQGRIKSDKTLGFYRRPGEEVRIKRPADIETAAHEIAHLLDDRIPEIRRQWTPASAANKAIRDELRGVSYDKSKLYEGFAEFVRLWATQKEQARAKAPGFYGWFEDFVGRSEFGPALRRAQEGMHAWFDQDALNRAASKIGDPGSVNDGLSSLSGRFRQSVADDLHGILEMERSLTGKVSPMGAYETARLTRSSRSITEGALLYGAPKVKGDRSHAFEGKGLKQILDPVAGKIDDFLLYAVGRSARELRGQGREHLFTKNEIDAMVRLETPEFREAFRGYQEWNKVVLDFAQAKGLINPWVRSQWKRVEYLPFHRVGQPGETSRVPGDWHGIKALTGGSDNLRDVLGNIIGNAATLIDAALKNEARLRVANLTALRGSAKFMAKIPTEDRIVRAHRDAIEKSILGALGIENKKSLTPDQRKAVEQIIGSLSPMVELLQRGQPPGGRNVVAVLREGKPEYYEVADPVLYRSLTSLNRPARGWLVDMLAIPRRIGQASITLAFDFMAANMARDTLMGWVMSRHGFKPLIDSARGFVSRVTADQSYKDFIANGGGFASYLVDETAFRTHLEKFYTGKGIDPRTVWDAPAKLLHGLERIAESFEVATRIGEFRKAVARGEHPRHAAYSAREVSTDFAMRGDSAALGFLYDTVIFLKAGVNGVDRFYRGIAKDANKVDIAAKTALIALASMGLYSLNRGNPLYDDLEDWDKDTHWHFFVPTSESLNAVSEGGELPPLEQRYHHFRYPKIWEIGAITSIAERSLGGFLDGQPKEIARHAADIIRNTFRFEYVPQALSPLYEQAINRNRFTDRPIESEAVKDLQPWARFEPYTSESIRALGEAQRHLPADLQLSPVRLEALIRGYLNTWALYGLSLADAALFDTKPDARLDQMPVIRRFYSQEPMKHSAHLTEFYDALREATEARRTLKFMDRIFRKDLGDEIENSRANLEYGQLNRANEGMGVIRNELAKSAFATDIRTVQDMVRERAQATGRADLPSELQARGVWNDLGALKGWLRDDLVTERNKLAKDVMTDIRSLRQGER